MHPRADLYIEIFYLFKNFGGDKIWKSGRKSKKWNWICLLVFVIATWANRENYTVNFFHKKIFKIQQKKIFQRKKMIEESVELSWDEKRELRRKKRLRSFQEIDRYLFGRKWPISTENDQIWPIFGVVTYV